MTTIQIVNDFHDAAISIRPHSDGTVSARTVARIRRAMCPKGCTCGGPFRSGQLVWLRNGVAIITSNEGR